MLRCKKLHIHMFPSAFCIGSCIPFLQKKRKKEKKYYKISVFLIKKLMLQSDPLISLWTFYGRLEREEKGPGSSFLLRTLCRAQSTALDTGKCCWLGFFDLISLSLHSSFLSLFSSPFSVARWARCTRCFGSADSAICAGVWDAVVGQLDTPLPWIWLLPPPPLFTRHPHQLSCVGCSTCLLLWDFVS